MAVAIGFLLLGGATGWAASVVLSPPPDLPTESAYTSVEVRPGEVSSSLRLNTGVEWRTAAFASNLATGTVTTVLVSPGQVVATGTPLYTVNLKPVVVAEGVVPAFGSIQRGDANSVVRQLQQMLKELGLYDGAVDGEFGSGTERAVRAWQRSIGQEPTGVVESADIVFVSGLPARIALDSEAIQIGKVLSGGENLIQILASTPSFTMQLTPDQASIIPDGARVDIQSPGGETWEARTGSRTSADGSVTLNLDPASDQNVCLDACEEIPVGTRSLLSSEVFLVEPSDGLVVPTAAIVTDANGSTMVIDLDGSYADVEVVASAQGMAVVKGVPSGTSIRVPAVSG